MYQTDQSNAVSALPTPAQAGTPGYFTGGNPATATPATTVDPDFLNMLMMELINLVEAAGITPSKTTYTQVLSAVKVLSAATTILADTGSANAYAASNTPPLTASSWVDGVVQRVKIGHTNTGASTYSPDGTTALPIFGLGLVALQGGELIAGSTATLVRMTIAGVNSGNPICILLDCPGGALQVAPATQAQHALQLQQLVAYFQANALGVSAQGWADYTSSRAMGTTYTNTTGRPIAVNVYVLQSEGSAFSLNVDSVGVSLSNGPTGGYTNLFAIVPPGATYGVTYSGSPTLDFWLEMR